MPGDVAKTVLAGTRFADVRWVEETGSTNADLLALARDGAPDGIVLVADHQTAGRGRAGRSFVAPPRASLLLSVLVRVRPEVAGLTAMAMGLAAADAVDEVAGFRPRLKWPNDLVWPGDGTSDDRKLAGLLAETHWPPDGDVAVVVGIGLNVNWPAELPEDLAGIAIAINHVAGVEIVRERVLIALLQRFEHWLPTAGTPDLLGAWRDSSATLGRRVRVDLGSEVVEGIADNIDNDGRLIVDGRTIAAGDVVHLRAG